jgi:hypothetical protein
MADDVTHGDPVPYVALLKKVYPRLKSLDPHATIIGGVISGAGIRDGWMEPACKSGLLDSLDALSYHPYCYGAPNPRDRLPETGLMSRIQQNAGIMRRYQKRNTPVFLTEIGWPTHAGENGSSPRVEAQWLARTYLVARTVPFLKGLWWYDFSDGLDRNDPEANFGIVTHSLDQKPAYRAMRDICRLFAEAQYDGELEADPGIRIIKFTRVSGETLWVAWTIDDTRDWEVTFTRISRSEWVPPPASIAQMGGPETETKWGRKDDLLTLSVKLSGMPLVIDTGNADVEVSWRHAER